MGSCNKFLSLLGNHCARLLDQAVGQVGAGAGELGAGQPASFSQQAFPSKQVPQAALGCHPFHLSCLGSFLGPWQESKHRIAV